MVTFSKAMALNTIVTIYTDVLHRCGWFHLLSDGETISTKWVQLSNLFLADEINRINQEHLTRGYGRQSNCR